MHTLEIPKNVNFRVIRWSVVCKMFYKKGIVTHSVERHNALWSGAQNYFLWRHKVKSNYRWNFWRKHQVETLIHLYKAIYVSKSPTKYLQFVQKNGTLNFWRCDVRASTFFIWLLGHGSRNRIKKQKFLKAQTNVF